jgi:chromosome segregation ATPase
MTDHATTTPKFDAAKLLELWNGTIARLQSFLPVEEELNRFKADKAKHLAELAAIKAQVDANHQAIAAHDLNLAELKRQRARAEEELGVVQRDLGRTREDYEALVKRLNDIKRRNP